MAFKIGKGSRLQVTMATFLGQQALDDRVAAWQPGLAIWRAKSKVSYGLPSYFYCPCYLTMSTLQGAWRLTFSAVVPRNLAHTPESPV